MQIVVVTNVTKKVERCTVTKHTVTSVPPTILVRVSPQVQEERGQQGEVDELGRKMWLLLHLPHLLLDLALLRRRKNSRCKIMNGIFIQTNCKNHM